MFQVSLVVDYNLGFVYHDVEVCFDRVPYNVSEYLINHPLVGDQMVNV